MVACENERVRREMACENERGREMACEIERLQREVGELKSATNG